MVRAINPEAYKRCKVKAIFQGTRQASRDDIGDSPREPRLAKRGALTLADLRSRTSCLIMPIALADIPPVTARPKGPIQIVVLYVVP